MQIKVLKYIVFGILILFCLAFLCLCVAASMDDKPVVLPEESERDKLIIASDGCCFWVENMEVSLHNGNGEIIVLSYNENVFEHDIFKYKIPEFEGSNIKLVVKFMAFYGDECEFSSTVMAFENIGELKKSGVLLYLAEGDDMYLTVKAGDNQVSYKRGGAENRWSIVDI